jgi:hypothetical protein
MKSHIKIPAQLAPVGKDGKDSLWMNKKLPDGDYGATWAGVVKYCKDLKLDPYIVGWHIEKLFGDKTNTNHLLFAAAVYASLKKVKARYYKIKRQRTPRLEDDLHYAIRMDLTRIKKLFYEATTRKKTKDFYKSARQMYLDIMKKRKSYVLDLFKRPPIS